MSNGKRKFSHREYVLDRAQRIHRMFEELEGAKDRQEEFLDEPLRVASQFDVKLSDEEAFAIKALRGADLDSLKERLVVNPVAFFDANCSCAMSDLGLIKSNPS
jgi:hypothetical protein